MAANIYDRTTVGVLDLHNEAVSEKTPWTFVARWVHDSDFTKKIWMWLTLYVHVVYYCFYLDKKYPTIIGTPCNQRRENAQFCNKSTGTYAPEYTVW